MCHKIIICDYRTRYQCNTNTIGSNTNHLWVTVTKEHFHWFIDVLSVCFNPWQGVLRLNEDSTVLVCSNKPFKNWWNGKKEQDHLRIIQQWIIRSRQRWILDYVLRRHTSAVSLSRSRALSDATLLNDKVSPVQPRVLVTGPCPHAALYFLFC